MARQILQLLSAPNMQILQATAGPAAPNRARICIIGTVNELL